MTKEKISEEEISERTGFSRSTKADESEEDNKPEDNEEESQTTEESEEGDESTKELDDLPEDEDEKSKDESESEEDDEDDEDDESSSKGKRTVPYNKLKTERKKRKEAEKKLGNFLENFDTKIGTAVEKALTSVSDKKDQPGEAEKVAAELSEEVGLDEKGLAKILKTAVDLASKGQVSPELLKRLENLGKLEESQKKIEERQKEDEDVSKFNKEWDSFVPWLKKKFPNAGDDELGEAKNAMDDLAHSKKYHLIPELDYIFFKNRNKFQTILTLLKGKSGEKSKTIKGEKVGEDETDKLTDIENLTPEIIKKRDAEDTARNKSAEKDYTIIEPV